MMTQSEKYNREFNLIQDETFNGSNPKMESGRLGRMYVLRNYYNINADNKKVEWLDSWIEFCNK